MAGDEADGDSLHALVSATGSVELWMARPSAKGLISIVLPDLRGGGAERLHLDLATAWIGAGYQVEFVLMRRTGELLGLVPAGATVWDLGVDRVRFSILALRRYLKQRRPAVTLAAMWPLTSAAAIGWILAGRPGKLFLSDHNQLSIDRISEGGTNPAVLKHSMRLTYPGATGIIAVSKGVKDDICALGDLDPDSVRVIYNPAAIEAGRPAVNGELRHRLWGAKDGFNVLSVGKLKPQKDHATLLRAFASLPSDIAARLTIVGDGPLLQELSELKERLGLGANVRLAGFQIDPADWYRTADVFVLSSRWEGFGNVIVEALSFGVPVVSTDCPSGPSEILEDGRYGLLVPVADPSALALAIQQVKNQPRNPAPLVRRSRDFTVDRIASQYLDAFGLDDGGR